MSSSLDLCPFPGSQETMRFDSHMIQKHVDIAFDKVCVLKMESLVLKASRGGSTRSNIESDPHPVALDCCRPQYKRRLPKNIN
jgi:hypothetical protein